MQKFNFHNPGRMVFGENSAVKRAGKELDALGCSRVMLVTDGPLSETDMIETIKEALSERLVAVFDQVVPDTGVDVVGSAVKTARRETVDSVISVGGGSSIDTAKAVAAALTHDEEAVRDLIGFNKLKNKPAPHIAVPTTAGTGSECTSMAMIKDREKGKKLVLLDDKLIPEVAILDPVLTVGLPPNLTASTGMDAMTHAAEAIMSTRAMPPADALALHSVRMIMKNLPRALQDGSDLNARGAMLVASSCAGQAFQNAYVGIVHAMAHALGGMFGVPHGLANAIMLAVGMEYNSEAAPQKVAMIGEAMKVSSTGDVKEDAQKAIIAMREFASSLGIPLKLSDAGVDGSGLDECAQLALKDPSIYTNPKMPEDAEAIKDLLQKCL